ncbi:MAG: hypothetical protein JW863_21850 [Chitinispirillaceae bacterium]|nr:hypothetical protein [Chitinispirillaceae bacterium]
MKLRYNYFLILSLLAVVQLQTGAEPAPIRSWLKVLPAVCRFAAVKDDSIIAVTDRIAVLSSTGEPLSQSEPLADLQNLKTGQFSFNLLEDNSLLLLQNGYSLKNISLSGEVCWSYSFRDTLLGVTCNDIAENDDGTLFVCGSVNNQSALLATLSPDGKLLSFQHESLFGIFYSITITAGTLYLSSSQPSMYLPTQMACYDLEGKLVNTGTDSCKGTVLSCYDSRIYSVGPLDAGNLFKRHFSAASDIIFERFDLNGTRTDSVRFDFGKYEIPMDLIRQSDGVVMITSSDETINMGTNFLNYFITKLSGDLRQEWQLTFGTDTSGMDGATHHRTFFADETGVILASHNDTLMKYVPSTTVLHQPSLSAPVSGSGPLRAFYLNGRSISSGEGVRPTPHASGILIPAHGVSMKRKTILSIEK